jgi:hypothetical protein
MRAGGSLASTNSAGHPEARIARTKIRKESLIVQRQFVARDMRVGE